MSIISYRIKKDPSICIGQLLARSGRGSFRHLLITVVRRERQDCEQFRKICKKKSVIESETFSGCNLYTWIRVVSTTHAFLKIVKKIFFCNISDYLTRQFSHDFARHHAFLAIFVFHFCVSLYLSLLLCIKSNFNF